MRMLLPCLSLYFSVTSSLDAACFVHVELEKWYGSLSLGFGLVRVAGTVLASCCWQCAGESTERLNSWLYCSGLNCQIK